ncbi:MAG: excinuclease ABC subunit UvrC, partial [Thermodesulfobacteriota bacterium]|nr:excinuclease ABC subunit UvrC [Thermodesulfobacteriota bacterium]
MGIKDLSMLKEKIKNAPGHSGVYLMKDVDDRVIYVGKAKNLRARVRSYFGGTDSRRMVPFLLSRIKDIEFIVTDTEKETLILENNLIKKYRPRYNINLRDDKNFYSIRIDTKEKFPRFQLVRRVQKDGARYFGPYSSSASVKQVLHYLYRIFPLRTCRDLEFKTRKRPCMEFQIKRCLAPCCGLVTDGKYRKIVAEAVLFIEGRGGRLVRQLRLRMDRAAEELNFEEAARIRDKISAIETTLEKQRVVSTSFKDQDIFGLYREGDRIQVYAIYVRKGAIIGQRRFSLMKTRMESFEALSSLLKQYYNTGPIIPGEIIVPEHMEDTGIIEQWLTEKKGGKVSLILPRRGDKKALLDMALSNAENALRAEEKLETDNERVLEDLTKGLLLKKMPCRIECFDISNIGGKYAVGSLVSFNRGVPEKSRYRRFRIKTKEDADDYGMMREVLERRYSGGKDIPDLIVVDGGKGQLGVALSVLRGLGLEEVDVIGLAKESRAHPAEGLGAVYRDRVYLPNRKNPLYLSKRPQALFLLQRVRDEAHRFAVTYHRKVKEKEDFRSVLDNIPGIGKTRKSALLAHFLEMDKIANASREKLEEVPGIGENAAYRIFEYFHAQR